MRYQIMGLLLAITVAGCSGEQKKESKAPKVPSYTTDYNYTYNPDSTDLTWIAYKFTDKVGVPGRFDSLEITGLKVAKNPINSVRGAKFKIYTRSINTGIDMRDDTIYNNFFARVLGQDVIVGRVMEFNDDGTGIIALGMNQESHNVKMSWKRPSHNIVEVTGKIDVDQWGLKSAREHLNQVCHDLHTGSDGVSKLWPDVSISIRAKFDYQ